MARQRRLRRLSATTAPRKQSTTRKPIRPGLLRIELLEDRRVLSIVSPAVELFGVSPALFVESQGHWADEAVRLMHQGNGANVAMTDGGVEFQVFRRELVEGAAAEQPDELVPRWPDDRLRADDYVTEVLQFSAGFVGANTVVFGGLPIGEHSDHLQCGARVIELSSGRTIATLQFHSGVEEIFAVEVLPGTRNPQTLRSVAVGRIGTRHLDRSGRAAAPCRTPGCTLSARRRRGSRTREAGRGVDMPAARCRMRATIGRGLPPTRQCVPGFARPTGCPGVLPASRRRAVRRCSGTSVRRRARAVGERAARGSASGSCRPVSAVTPSDGQTWASATRVRRCPVRRAAAVLGAHAARCPAPLPVYRRSAARGLFEAAGPCRRHARSVSLLRGRAVRGDDDRRRVRVI